MRPRSVAVATACALMLAACGAAIPGKSYQLSTREARKQLLRITPPKFVFGDHAQFLPAVDDGSQGVHWNIANSKGAAVLRLDASLSGEGDNQSRIAVSVEAPHNSMQAQIAQRLEQNPTVANLYRAAMIEQIDAKLNQRAFSLEAIGPEIAAATAANMPRMMNDLDRSIEADQRRKADNIASAYRNE